MKIPEMNRNVYRAIFVVAGLLVFLVLYQFDRQNSYIFGIFFVIGLVYSLISPMMRKK